MSKIKSEAQKQTDNSERGGGRWKLGERWWRLDKGHICMTHRHKQHCEDGLREGGLGGGVQRGVKLGQL